MIISEALYAEIVRKQIIPIRFEHYVASGWLGRLINDLECYEGTSDEVLKNEFSRILTAISKTEGRLLSRNNFNLAPIFTV